MGGRYQARRRPPPSCPLPRLTGSSRLADPSRGGSGERGAAALPVQANGPCRRRIWIERASGALEEVRPGRPVAIEPRRESGQAAGRRARPDRGGRLAERGRNRADADQPAISCASAPAGARDSGRSRETCARRRSTMAASASKNLRIENRPVGLPAVRRRQPQRRPDRRFLRPTQTLTVRCTHCLRQLTIDTAASATVGPTAATQYSQHSERVRGCA
jgi:hypothetical protein